MDLKSPLTAQQLILLLVCGLALLSCKDESVNLVPGQGVLLAERTGRVDPRTAIAPVDSPCRVAQIEWRDRSAPLLVEGLDGETWLESLVAGRTELGKPGWTLFLELAVAPAASAPGEFHFGVRGFLKDLNQVPPPVLESTVSGEQVLETACGEGWSGSACRQTLWEGVLADPLAKVVGELTFLCEVRRMDGAALTAALLQADSWQEAELARTAGELGDKTVAPALRKLLDSSDSKVQLRAIAALGRLQDEAAIPLLVRLTRGAEESTVHAVMVALADIESAEARRYLKTWSEHHPLLSMRELAKGLLGE
jgi:hypothetical protein